MNNNNNNNNIKSDIVQVSTNKVLKALEQRNIPRQVFELFEP